MSEGYVYFAYGATRYVEHVVASVVSLRRYDTERPVAVFCSDEQRAYLERHGLDLLFDLVEVLPAYHQSIVGFKHHLDRFMPFGANLYVDADTVWCRDPSPLWSQLSAYEFTITGTDRSDFFFGGPKDWRVVLDYVLDRRRTTMKRFGLTHLPRIQSGLMYARDYETTRRVCEAARWFKDQEPDTHFRSRLQEDGRSEESCEWSLAMAMSQLQISVFPWFNHYHSPQLDFVEDFASYDPDFHSVSCYYPCDSFIFSLRGIRSVKLRRFLVRFLSLLPGKGDFLWVTPFVLHFGWLHQKRPFYDFAGRTWQRLLRSPQESQRQATVAAPVEADFSAAV